MFEKSFQVPFSCTIWLRATVTARHRHLAVKHSDELVCMIQTEKLTSLTEPDSRMGETAKAWCRGRSLPMQCVLGLYSKCASLPRIRHLPGGKYCEK